MSEISLAVQTWNGGPLHPKIEILPYQDRWPGQFAQLKKFLGDCLGRNVLSIDHIGSTSIPGLGAKDRIDVQISVADLSEHTQAVLDKKLTGVGYCKTRRLTDHKPPWDQSQGSFQWEKLYLRGTNPNIPFASNIHIRVVGRSNQAYALLFRDYLRNHPDAMQAYYRLKKELSHYHATDIDAYCEIKDPVCDLIMVSARDWAFRTDWKNPTED